MASILSCFGHSIYFVDIPFNFNALELWLREGKFESPTQPTAFGGFSCELVQVQAPCLRERILHFFGGQLDVNGFILQFSGW